MKENEELKYRDSSRCTPIAIIGIGCLFPKADNLNAYWANITNRIDAITEVPGTHWRAKDYCAEGPTPAERVCTSAGGFISSVDFDPLEFGISPNAMEAIDTSQLLGLVVTRQALNDAGYGPERTFDRERISVILGVTGTLEMVIPLGARLGHPVWRRCLKEAGVEDQMAEDVVRRISDSYVSWQENSFPGLLGNVVAGRIGKHFNLGGTNCVVDAACASSMSAIHMAGMELVSGRADMAITGGIDTFNDVFMYTCFHQTQALSPTGNARPFDVRADGTILGEGLGVLVLKRLEDARRDNDRVYAVIRGIGTSTDGRGDAIYAPSPAGQAKALQKAHSIAEVTADTIELVEAHGTGTKAGDAAELQALIDVFGAAGKKNEWCALGSVKSQIGHTKAAAGVAGIIKATMALYHKVLPPTIKVSQPLKAIVSGLSPFYVNTQKRPWMPAETHPRRAAVSSFGFGGSNYHCVLEEYDSEKPEINWDGQVQILAFSAEDTDKLVTAIGSWPSSLSWEKLREKASESRAEFRANHDCRLLIVAQRDRTDLQRAFVNASAMLEKSSGRRSWSTPDGVYFGAGRASGKLGLIFPGQGSQYVDMLLDLACAFPQMQKVLEAAVRAFGKGKDPRQDRRLIDYIYARPAFDDRQKEDNETLLRATQIAQPAIGAVSLGALKILEYFGIQPEALAGHSYGELTALCASERINEDDLFSLSILRGRLMGEGEGDMGSMIAAQASMSALEAVISEESLNIVIANKNAPNQAVLSGPTCEIEKAASALAAREIRNKRLPVSAAFHSPAVAHVERPFLSELNNIEFKKAGTPVFANKTADIYPENQDDTRRILAAQLVSPIEFVREIENMYGFGVRTFLEVGPGARLTGLVKSILADCEHTAVSVDASAGKRPGLFDLACTLALLSAKGYSLNLPLWNVVRDNEAISVDTKKARMTISICGANYMKPRPKRPADSPLKPLTRAAVSETAAGSTVREKPANRHSPDTRLRETVATSTFVSPVDSGSLKEALRLTQENMTALQRFQEQTAQLHQQFLQGQETAQRTFHKLVDQQQILIEKSLGMTIPQADTAASPSERPSAPVQPVPGANREAPSDLKYSQPMQAVEAVQVPEPKTGDHASSGTTIPSESSSGSDLSEDRIGEVLLEVIAEKTGYPVEMLEMEMEVDADLGIDSIKRVEIMSTLQEKMPETPAVSPELLGSLKTLRQIVEFLSGSPDAGSPVKPSAAEAPAAELPPPDVTPAGHTFQDNGIERLVLVRKKIDENVARQKISIPEGSRIWITDEDSGLAQSLKENLRSLKLRPELVSCDDLSNMERPSELSGLLILSPASNAGDTFVKNSFRILQFAGPGLKKSAQNGGSVLLTVSRMDGFFGLTSLNGQNDPASGGIAGLLKTARHEWHGVHCKAVDLAGDMHNLKDAASFLSDEMFLSGPVEVGLSDMGRFDLHLNPVSLEDSLADGENAPLEKDDVVVITGGARGVTAEVAVALSRAFSPTLVLMGRSKEPAPEPDWLVHLAGEAEIKKRILEQAEGKVSPTQLEDRYRMIMADRELVHNIERIKSAGSRVIYCSVDIRDERQVRSLIKEVRDKAGPVKGLIHGAGVLADRLIEDKTDEQFDLVYSTKVKGLRVLLKAVDPDDLKVMVMFSSSTGRYGRLGQADYAAANEVLNKFAQQQARLLPNCRVVSVNWGPWDGGMVTPSLKKIFEEEGVGLIDLEAGANYLVQEICSNSNRPVEVVIMGKKTGTHRREVATPTDSSLSTAFEIALSTESFPFLKSHVIDGQYVLPMAIIIEWLGHAALHGNPGMKFAGFDNLRILKGVTLNGAGPLSVKVMAGRAVKNGSLRMVPVELCSSRGNGDRVFVNAQAEIALAARLPEADRPVNKISLNPYSVKAREIYNNGRLFHGPHFHGLEHVEGCSDQGIAAAIRTAPVPSAWVKHPMRSAWLADPLVLDSSFQMMILWSFEKHGVGSLPCFVGRYRQFRSVFPKDSVKVLIRVTKANEHQAMADIEFMENPTGDLIARMQDYECVIDASLNCAFECNHSAKQNGIEVPV